MALANDSWLDRLDIPDIPDFADPTFNPYVYDGADEWFSTHRETCTRSQMAIVSQTSHYGANASALDLSGQELPPRSHSSRSHQENSGPSVAFAVPKRPRVPFMTAKPNRILSNVPVKNVGFHTVAKLPVPGPRPMNVVKTTHVSKSMFTSKHVHVPKPVAAAPVHRVDETKTVAKLRPLPTVVKPFVPVRLPLPSKKPQIEVRPPIMNRSRSDNNQETSNSRFPVANVIHLRPASNLSLIRKADEVDGGQKRRSVVAARAGEYFAHILRAYPEEFAKGRGVPGWK